MITFRQLPGYLLCRNYNICITTRALNILSVHIIYNNINRKCMHLRFTILNYITMKLTYIGEYDMLDNFKELDVLTFFKLVRPSIKHIPFE